jgi:hypothetical protein
MVLGVALLFAAWPTSGTIWLSNTLTGSGVAVLGVVAGWLAMDWRARKRLGHRGLDRAVVVYTSRSRYPELLANVSSAHEIDIVGMSLAYAVDYLRDNARSFFRRVDHVRVLLPGSRAICDERDRAQNAAPGTLWQASRDLLATVVQLQNDYPNSIAVRFFTLQPYGAMTRIDDTVWVAPYITKGGASSPLMVMSRTASEHLFQLYLEHFDRIWTDPGTSHWPDHGCGGPPFRPETDDKRWSGRGDLAAANP